VGNALMETLIHWLEMVFVMMGPTILAVFLMEVIVVELMSTQYIVLIVYATHMIPVMVHLT
jgi:hypothetical protein